MRSKETNTEWGIKDGGKENTAEELCQYSGWTTGGRPRNRSSTAAGGRDFPLLQSVHGCQRLFPRRGVRLTTNLQRLFPRRGVRLTTNLQRLFPRRESDWPLTWI